VDYFNVFIEFVIILFLFSVFFFFFFGCKACRITTWSGIQPKLPALGDEVPTTGTPEKSLSFPFHSCHPISLLFSPSVLSLDSWFPCDDLLTGHVISGPSSLEWVIHSPLSPTPSPYPRIYLHHFWYFFYIYKWAMTTCSVWAGELRREGWKPTYNGVFVCTTLTYFCLSDCFYLPNCHPDPSLYIPVEQCLIISSLL